MLWVILFSLDSLFVGFSSRIQNWSDEGYLNHPRTCPPPRSQEERGKQGRPELYPQELLQPDLYRRWRSSLHRWCLRNRDSNDSPFVGRSRLSRKWGRTSTAAVQPRSNVPRRDWGSIGIFLRTYLVLRPLEFIVLPSVPATLYSHSHPVLELTDKRRSQEEWNALRLDYN